MWFFSGCGCVSVFFCLNADLKTEKVDEENIIYSKSSPATSIQHTLSAVNSDNYV